MDSIQVGGMPGIWLQTRRHTWIEGETYAIEDEKSNLLIVHRILHAVDDDPSIRRHGDFIDAD
jgi:hypothetical protein